MSHGPASNVRIAAALCLFTCALSPAQQFEVASIKPSANDEARTLLQVLPGGGLSTSGATLAFLIDLAYEVRSFQILGGSGWIRSERFDVIAKSERSADFEKEPRDPTQVTAGQLKGMQDEMRPGLQALLAERFKLSLHRENREQPVYALTIGKGGAKIQPTSGNFGGLHIGRSQITATGATLEGLTTALANQLGRPVLDGTGLKGTFNFKLEWEAFRNDGDPLPAVPGGASIFTALQEQLGLKLESTKGPVQVLVIDHVERPDAN